MADKPFERLQKKTGPLPEHLNTSAPAEPSETNRDHPDTPGERTLVPGAGVVHPDADAGPKLDAEHAGDQDFPGAKAGPDETLSAPGAERPGTTDARPAASVARGGASGGLGEREAPSSQGQTAYAPPTGGIGAPSPGSSGEHATSDPNYTAANRQNENELNRKAKKRS